MYALSDGSNLKELLKQLMKEAEERNLEISGDTYEEFIRDEITVSSPEEYAVRISMHVKKQRV